MNAKTIEERATQVATADQNLIAGVARIRKFLERALNGAEAPTTSESWPADAWGPLLQELCSAFHLSPFERDVLLLCVAGELDPAIPALCMACHDDQRLRWPTFRLAVDTLPESHWSAFLPDAPLRHWKLIDVGSGEALVNSPLRVEESVLHFLMGFSSLDERLRNLSETVDPPDALPSSYRQHAEVLLRAWSDEPRVVAQLQGNATRGKRALAAAVCAGLGLELHVMRAGVIPGSAGEREALARIWDRDAILGRRALLLQAENASPAEWEAACGLADRIAGPLAVICAGPLELDRRKSVRITVDRPGADEQRALWQRVLGRHAEKLNGELDAVVAHFALDIEALERAGSRVLKAVGEDGGDLFPQVWEACRNEARPALEGRTRRIEPRASWTDLVLPQASLEMLHTIATHVRHQGTVFERWGFAAQSSRGRGLAALFSGPSGTGKTLAAEVLAGELHLDLYHIDLSQVVSKFIGETEKNLCSIFDAAEHSGAVLLFDEADALFGKRSEVKDSHDRYANIEVSYLLQRMEAYRGLAILTTNMRGALDAAFLRRIRFIVNFPFPDLALRRAIWDRMFPPQTPISGLNLDKLARLNFSGGNIRNVALNAAFLAAEEDSPVRMDHLLKSARRECSKLEKQLSGAEIGGWA
jgi:hypothetical protein